MNTHRAYAAMKRQLNSGTIKRPCCCELCGSNKFIIKSKNNKRPPIVAHHWRGYDYPLDVWWICYKCNTKLSGFHDGSLTKKQAKFLINRCLRFEKTSSGVRFVLKNTSEKTTIPQWVDSSFDNIPLYNPGEV